MVSFWNDQILNHKYISTSKYILSVGANICQIAYWSNSCALQV